MPPGSSSACFRVQVSDYLLTDTESVLFKQMKTISPKSTKAQLIAHINEMETQLNVTKETSLIISWESQIANLKARWDIHTTEFKAARDDMFNTGKAVRGYITDFNF